MECIYIKQASHQSDMLIFCLTKYERAHFPTPFPYVFNIIGRKSSCGKDRNSLMVPCCTQWHEFLNMNIRDPSLTERILQARKEFFPFDPNMRDCFSSNEQEEESRKLAKKKTREKTVKNIHGPLLILFPPNVLLHAHFTVPKNQPHGPIIHKV